MRIWVGLPASRNSFLPVRSLHIAFSKQNPQQKSRVAKVTFVHKEYKHPNHGHIPIGDQNKRCKSLLSGSPQHACLFDHHLMVQHCPLSARTRPAHPLHILQFLSSKGEISASQMHGSSSQISQNHIIVQRPDRCCATAVWIPKLAATVQPGGQTCSCQLQVCVT